jgi:hypothetical protein
VLDFYYVSLVDNKCTKASQRLAQYNLYGFPTVFFDGGYRVKVGAGSVGQAKNAYEGRIITCGTRFVPDIEAKVNVVWLGNATMSITVTVDNHEATAYEGHLRANITEVESSLNWKDSAGKLYKFPLLAYAFNKSISIPAGGTWKETNVWDGHDFNNGHGQSYGNIQADNIMIIAAVFNDTVHQGYAYPPSSNPFNAYYVDETVAAMPVDPLIADADTLPEGGGTVNIDLNAGGENDGRNYLLVGGVTGTAPGFPLPGGQATLPINWDVFSDIVMGLLNSPVFSNFLGGLDGEGMSAAQLNSPALPPGSAGLVLYFAYCLNNPFDFASNPIEITVVP